jgi:hypothetical protein
MTRRTATPALTQTEPLLNVPDAAGTASIVLSLPTTLVLLLPPELPLALALAAGDAPHIAPLQLLLLRQLGVRSSAGRSERALLDAAATAACAAVAVATAAAAAVGTAAALSL